MKTLLLLFSLFLMVGCGPIKNNFTKVLPVTNGKLAEVEEEQKDFDDAQTGLLNEMADAFKEAHPESPKAHNVSMKAYSLSNESNRRLNKARDDVDAYNSGPGIGDVLSGLTGDPTAIMNIVLAFLGITGVGYGAVKERKANRLKMKGIELSELNPTEAMKKRRADKDFN